MTEEDGAMTDTERKLLLALAEAVIFLGGRSITPGLAELADKIRDEQPIIPHGEETAP
jgi:hypothetical protein